MWREKSLRSDAPSGRDTRRGRRQEPDESPAGPHHPFARLDKRMGSRLGDMMKFFADRGNSFQLGKKENAMSATDAMFRHGTRGVSFASVALFAFSFALCGFLRRPKPVRRRKLLAQLRSPQVLPQMLQPLLQRMNGRRNWVRVCQR